MSVSIATDLPALGLMLAEFACCCYEFGLVGTHSTTLELERADMLSVVSGGRTLALTGPEPFGLEDSMAYVAGRITSMLETGATIVAGDACISIGADRPLAKAYRPTEDTLIVETGGSHPACLVLIADRERGAVV